MSDALRYTRQTRLAEVGAEGQARIRAARVLLGAAGFARQIEGTYLRLAGATPIDSARAADDRSQTTSADPALVQAGLAALGCVHDGPREVAEGALFALVALRATLGLPQDPR